MLQFIKHRPLHADLGQLGHLRLLPLPSIRASVLLAIDQPRRRSSCLCQGLKLPACWQANGYCAAASDWSTLAPCTWSRGHRAKNYSAERFEGCHCRHHRHRRHLLRGEAARAHLVEGPRARLVEAHLASALAHQCEESPARALQNYQPMHLAWSRRKTN